MIKSNFYIIIIFLISSCYSKDDLIGDWEIYEVKSVHEGETKILKLNPPFIFRIINDSVAINKDIENDTSIIGRLDIKHQAIIFPSGCCAACFEYKQGNNKLYLKNVLGSESIAYKIETEK